MAVDGFPIIADLRKVALTRRNSPCASRIDAGVRHWLLTMSACPRHAHVTHHVFHLIIVCRTLIARPA